MFRIVQTGNSLPASFIVDPSAEFQPGCWGELAAIGNQIMITVSNGTAPLGVIDDIKTRAFTNISWNETIIQQVNGVIQNGQYVTPIDLKLELRRPNVIPHSFTSTVPVTLNPINGIITVLAGTALNIDLTGGGIPNGIKIIVNYTYQVANIPGDDSTQGTGRVTIWYQRMFAQTDQYETNVSYPVKANLFVNEFGLLTTRRPSNIHPAVAMVTASPSPMMPYLEFLMY